MKKYTAIITEKTTVEANSKEEAYQKFNEMDLKAESTNRKIEIEATVGYKLHRKVLKKATSIDHLGNCLKVDYKDNKQRDKALKFIDTNIWTYSDALDNIIYIYPLV